MNKVVLIGRLASDVESRTTPNGVATATFRIAVQRRFANAQGVREADFLTVVCWRQLAELCAKYLEKGHKCAVVGSIQARSYEAQDGSKRTVTEIIADEVEFLTERKEGAQNGNAGVQGYGEIPAGFEEVSDDQLPF